ncbi:MAG: bifunctional precorrin-2 dehydrogenase/sirohydrochlorin ferrochelatase [Candidatus Melainabacteria bacterium]|nr:bifunctional precorrin-2 dehydrogenase/sirohydrochlorin ferrochelatase [Candidatus Melainabacteria bacterium]
METNKLYPIFLKLTGKRVLIVGGGMIALQKLVSLLNTEAQLVVLAPNIIDEVYACRGEFPDIRHIKFIEREYEFGDEKDFDIVIAATDIDELNNSIANRCRDQGILVNSVDQADYCDFYVPSIVDSGNVKIAISTNGQAPAIAQKLRLELEQKLDQSFQELVERASKFRSKVKAKYQDSGRRMKLSCWYTDRQWKKYREAINAS